LDGNTVAIGSDDNDENGVDSGQVRVYGLYGEGTASSWKQLGQDINGQRPGDNSGFSVSLSADGKKVAIGAYGNDGNGQGSGHVRVYHMEEDDKGASWKQLGQDIVGEAAGDQSGYSVSLSADGKVLAIGAIYNDGNGNSSGHVRVYHIDVEGTAPSWKQLGQDINGKAAGDQSGRSVSLSADGKTLAIGAPSNSNDNGTWSGHVRVYYIDGEGTAPSWKQLGQDIDGELGFDYSGSSVSLSADGRTVAIGSPNNDNSGSQSGYVRVFDIDITDAGNGVSDTGGNEVGGTHAKLHSQPPEEPSYQPTGDHGPTDLPSAEPSSSASCIDTPGFHDMYGDGCDYYKEDPSHPLFCFSYGGDGQDGMTPNENCCACKDISSGS